jgi:hypothetical protein
MKQFLVCLIIITGLTACLEPPDFSDTPYIEYIGVSRDSMLQGVFEEDSISVFFHFEDGDGDLGREDNTLENNVFLIDTRTGLQDNSFAIPFIPPQGSDNGIEGTITLLLFSTCCIFPNGQDPCTPSQQFPYDTLRYEIYITDRAGNESNHIFTEPIVLLCN